MRGVVRRDSSYGGDGADNNRLSVGEVEAVVGEGHEVRANSQP